MKILFVTKDVELIGGTANSFISILDSVSGFAEKVYVLMPKSGPIQKVYKERKLQIIKMDYVPVWKELRGRLNEDIYVEWKNFLCAGKLAKFLKEEKIDVVYTNTGIIDVGAMAAVMTGKKHIWHHREFIHNHFHKKFIFETKEKYLLRKSDVVIAVSKGLLTELQRRYGINNGIVLYNCFQQEKYYIDRKEWFGHSELNCLVVGRIYQGKRQEEAVYAVKELISKYHIPVKLYLVGDGENSYLSQLRKIIVENGLQGNVSIQKYEMDITSLRERMDIEISCSQWEGFGRNIIEGMMGGLFVIGANSGATKELVRPMKNGLLYRPGKPEDLAKKIAWVWENLDMAKEIAQTGQRWALNKFQDKDYGSFLQEMCGCHIGREKT